MKIIAAFFISLFLLANLYAQNGEITYILLRHAEKDTSPAANKADVDLTQQGRERAVRFFETVREYKPEQIFSTIFRRTRETVTPLAQNLNPDYRLMIQTYDYAEIEEFAERLLKLDAKTIVVVGHNNTTPQLANLLIKQEKYATLPETEYGKIWIIKIKRKKGKMTKVIEDRVITY
ncbi:MAG: histidine phosphatase family protein [Pyrinomonadaceae bacterium]